MKRLLPFLFAAGCAFGAAGDYTVRDDLTLIIEDPYGNKIVAGQIVDHVKIRAVKVNAATDAFLNAKFAADKKQAVKDAKTIKDHGLTVPSSIKDDTESWIITDAEDPVKSKELKDANVVPPAEGIGCTIPEATKEKINNAK